MSSLTLRLRDTIRDRVDLTDIVADRVLGLDVDSVADLRIEADGRPRRVADMFEIVDGARDRLVLVGDLTRADHVGAGLKFGTMVVESSVGNRVASGMVGGQLIIAGDAGDYAGSGLRGGVVRIEGRVGDYCGGALPGHRRGMRGGVCWIGRSAGKYLGYRMRRGTMIVIGSTGPGAGARMIAGTLVVLGTMQPPIAIGMRRGTLVAAGQTVPPVHAGFTPPEATRLSFLPILWQWLESYLPAEAIGSLRCGSTMRAMGDRANGGLGEIVWCLPAGHEAEP